MGAFTMTLKYLGQSCFLITTDEGTRIVTDPFGKMPGLKMPDVEAEIVTVSHSHFDHNNVKAVNGNFLLALKTAEVKADGVTLHGVETFHDNMKGHLRGNNIIFIIKADGLSICHLGDLGHLLSDEQLAAIGHVDILLVPVGEVFTFSITEALKTITQINPTITIPMHYKVTGHGLGLRGVDKFLSIAGDNTKLKTNEIEVSAENIGEYKKIVVMQP
jgi:L-ascorbate metabolism protein UlaG (beta-lactamase superfamily)